MFEATNISAFFMRLALLCFLSCCFPLINNFLRSLVFQFFPQDKEITNVQFKVITVIFLIIPLCVTVFYPQIGSILGMIGSIAGLFIVYVLPTITYLKQIKTECEHPILAKAIKKNMYEIRVGQQP